MHRVLYALGIANIGLATAKLICRHFDYDLSAIQKADREELSAIEGIGDVIAGAFVEYMSRESNVKQLELLMRELSLQKPAGNQENRSLAGLSFVITGSLEHFENRNELKDAIEALGGKVTGSVTGKTTCLINNDISSNSTKNKKAKELNIPILTEEDFLEKYMKGGTENADSDSK